MQSAAPPIPRVWSPIPPNFGSPVYLCLYILRHTTVEFGMVGNKWEGISNTASRNIILQIAILTTLPSTYLIRIILKMFS